MPTSRDQAYADQTTDLYQAIGEFAVKFEHVTHAMQVGLTNLFSGAGLQNQRLTQIVLAELTAYPMQSILRATVAELVKLSDADRKICDALFKQVQDLIELRNDIIHSTWFVGWAHPTDTDFSDVAGMKLARSKKGAEVKSFKRRAEEFRTHAAACDKLANFIHRLCGCVLLGVEISHNFSLSRDGTLTERAG